MTTADAAPAAEPYPVHWVRRSLPRGVRHAEVARLVARRAHSADVVYATSMVRRAAAGAAVGRRPLVVKLVADEAFERAQRAGGASRARWTSSRARTAAGGCGRCARRARAALRRAALVLSPSAYLREVALGWGLDPSRVVVVPNPAPAVPELPARETLRAELGVDGTVLAFAGRLTAQKALDLALDAVRDVPDATLLLARRRARPRTARARRRANEGSTAACGFSAPARGTTCCGCSPPRTRPCSPPPGRTCRTPCSRRWPSAHP